VGAEGKPGLKVDQKETENVALSSLRVRSGTLNVAVKGKKYRYKHLGEKRKKPRKTSLINSIG